MVPRESGPLRIKVHGVLQQGANAAGPPTITPVHEFIRSPSEATAFDGIGLHIGKPS